MQFMRKKDANTLGRKGAEIIAAKLNAAIGNQGFARIVFSTGKSQLEMLETLVGEEVDWSKVTAFHLDEYIGLPQTHPASFIKFLKEQFAARLPVPLADFVFVNVVGDVQENIKQLTARLTEKPIDVGVVGIGENAHIAFNDPPADFETKESFISVRLDENCKAQQVGEGWFPNLSTVPERAITMTPYRIMQCKTIVSCVPHAQKADAVYKTLAARSTTNTIPATLLKEHPDWYMLVDENSASKCDEELLRQYR